MQKVSGYFNASMRTLELPSPHAEVWAGLRWGEAATTFTPAYWASQVWFANHGPSPNYRFGDSLIEEVAACLLGGHGFRSEVGQAAFHALKAGGYLVPGTTAKAIESVLRRRLDVAGRRIRYRFPVAKARYLAEFLARVRRESAPESAGAPALRDWLLTFHGIGPKTASWVARNWLNSDDVAIVDVHIYRAGVLTGFFAAGLSAKRDYGTLERAFVRFAQAINVSAAALDLVMWEQMRALQDIPIKALEARWLASGVSLRNQAVYWGTGAEKART